MKLHFLLALFLSTAACLQAARPLAFSEDAGDGVVIPNGAWRCPRHIVITTMPVDTLGGIRLRGALIAIARPRFLQFFTRPSLSIPFDPTAQTEATTSQDTPNEISSEEANSATNERPRRNEISELGTTMINVLSSTSRAADSEVQNAQAIAQGDGEGLPSDRPVTSKTLLDVLGAKSGTHEDVDLHSLPLKPQFPGKVFSSLASSDSSALRDTFSRRWPFSRNSQLVVMDQSDEFGDGATSSDFTPNEIMQRNEDGSTSFHKFVELPNGFISLDVYSSKPFIPISQSSESYSGETTTIFQSFAGSLDRFYGSVYGSIFVGIACGLILSMTVFYILSVFFPGESDDDATAFIVSTSQSPTTPLLDDAISSDSESVASEEDPPKYHPPTVDN